MARREHPRYENADWPDYEFHEFPMMVYPGSKDGGKTPDRDPSRPGRFLQTPITVNNEEERRVALEIHEPVQPEAPFKPSASNLIDAAGGTKRVATEEDERARLIAEADALGVQIDKRWSLARIEDAIATYQAGGEVV